MTVAELKINEPEWLECNVPSSVFVGQRIPIYNTEGLLVKHFIQVLDIAGDKIQVVKREVNYAVD